MYDVIIFGGGSAGLTAASIFKASGKNYLIVHQGLRGTTCASRGCMPSKALIQVAKTYHERHKFAGFGISGSEHVQVRIPAAMEHMRSLRDRFAGGMVDKMESYNIRYGAAKFVDKNTIEIDGERLQARAFIICTGSSPRIPDVFAGHEEATITTDTFFEQEDFPSRVAVVGLGAVGAELGQTLARLGVGVTGISSGSSVAGLQDPELLESAKEALGRDMRLMLNADVTAIEIVEDGYRLECGGQTVDCDKVLLAAGRTPNVNGLGLEDIGVQFTDRGVPQFDKQTLQISGFPIYMAGDCNAHIPLLHEASDEANMVAAQILGKAIPERRVPLQITFTEPNIAQIGQQPEQLDQEWVEGSVSYNDQGRARVMGENHGLLKIYAAKSDTTILGAALVAPAGEHMAHLLAMAVQQRMTVAEFLKFPFYHPAVEEGIRTALRQIDDKQRDCITDLLC